MLYETRFNQEKMKVIYVMNGADPDKTSLNLYKRGNYPMCSTNLIYFKAFTLMIVLVILESLFVILNKLRQRLELVGNARKRVLETKFFDKVFLNDRERFRVSRIALEFID